jgi:hypothetical protein
MMLDDPERWGGRGGMTVNVLVFLEGKTWHWEAKRGLIFN